MIIATEFGDGRQRSLSGTFMSQTNQLPHHQTVYNYLVEMIDARHKKGFPVEQELTDLLEAANYIRREMPTEQREFLETKESRMLDIRGDDFLARLDRVSARLRESNSNDLGAVFKQLQKEERDLDPRVFSQCADGPELSVQDFDALQRSARNKLRATLGKDPLPEPSINDQAEMARTARLEAGL